MRSDRDQLPSREDLIRPHNQQIPAKSNAGRGASFYSRPVLNVYDLWVLGLSNQLAWKCPTRSVLLPFYEEHMGAQHLDVGVGTGFYLEHSRLAGSEITLLDLNENCLRKAAGRVRKSKPEILVRDVTSSTFEQPPKRFDSIALFYVLHCLPGPMESKQIVIENLKRCLARDGVLYGATILGGVARHNAFARFLLRTYNEIGCFSNWADDIDGLRKILGREFGDVYIRQQNSVALFAAKR